MARLPCPCVAIPAFILLSSGPAIQLQSSLRPLAVLGLLAFVRVMADRHGPSCWCRLCVIELRRSLQTEPELSDEPFMEFDARGFRRMGPYDRPGRRSPESDLEVPALESEHVEPAPHTPADAVRCDSCSSLREQIERLTSENTRLNLRVNELLAASRASSDQSRTEDDGVRLVFSAADTEAIPLLREPGVLLRALQYHEQRLDALASLQSALETQLRSRP